MKEDGSAAKAAILTKRKTSVVCKIPLNFRITYTAAYKNHNYIFLFVFLVYNLNKHWEKKESSSLNMHGTATSISICTKVFRH